MPRSNETGLKFLREEAERQRIEENALLLDSTWFFADTLLGLDFDPVVHGDIFKEIDGDDWDEGFVYLPRGCFKSFMLASYVARQIARDRNWRGLITGISYKKLMELSELAQAFLMRREVVERFGTFENPGSWGKEGWTVAGRTRDLREPSLTVMSIESFKASGHYDFGGTDDAEDQDSTNTPDLIEKTRRVDSLMYPMISEGKRQRLTFGTFWDDSDLYNYKMRLFKLHDTVDHGGGQVEIVRRPFVRNKVTIEIPGEEPAVKRVFQFWKPATNPDGTALFPRKLSLQHLAILRASMTPSEYAAQYELDPIGKENAEFKKEYFRHADRLPEGPFEWYVLGDFARSLRPDSDMTGFCVVAIDKDYHWYVVEAGRFRFDPETDDLIDRIVTYHKAYKDAHFCFEEDGYATGIKKRLDEKLLLAHVTPRITWIKSGGRKPKNGRISSLRGQFAAGHVTLLPGTYALEEELLRGEKSRYKDTKDAFANLLEVAQAASPHFDYSEPKEPEEDPRDLDPAAPWHHNGGEDAAERRYARMKPEEVPWEVL